MDGGGRTQTSSASTKQVRAAICLFDTAFRKPEGKYLFGDQRDGTFGDIQKVDEDESELVDEEDDECEGKENLETKVLGGVARSLGDLSMKGSLDGELKSRHTVDSRNPMLGSCRSRRRGETRRKTCSQTNRCVRPDFLGNVRQTNVH